ncbi:hypothetical protein DITRI_Ditri01bG0137300 [Diplodiscus trichospermus]
MKRHAATLYHALAAKGHEIHVFTVPSERKHHLDIHEGNLHVYFVANDHGSVNCSLAFEIFNTINANGAFDYVHTESVSLPHWRAKMVPNVVVTWHGIWYEIMHSKLFKDLTLNSSVGEIRGAMPRLIDEIRYAELDPNVKVLSALEPSKLSEFYNALDVFVNPTLRPQGLNLTLVEAIHCGKPVVIPNFPSIAGTVVVNESFGYAFSPNVESFLEALTSVISDGLELL